MSDRKIIGKPFTPANAPRQGGKPGRHNKANRYAWKVIEDLLADYKEHGPAAINILRVERPYEYVKASLAATEIALKYTQQSQQAGALVQISINRFFPDKDQPTVTVDGVSDDHPPA
jgi:hypothetical protein